MKRGEAAITTLVYVGARFNKAGYNRGQGRVRNEKEKERARRGHRGEKERERERVASFEKDSVIKRSRTVVTTLRPPFVRAL